MSMACQGSKPNSRPDLRLYLKLGTRQPIASPNGQSEGQRHPHDLMEPKRPKTVPQDGRQQPNRTQVAPCCIPSCRTLHPKMATRQTSRQPKMAQDISASGGINPVRTYTSAHVTAIPHTKNMTSSSMRDLRKLPTTCNLQM